MKRLLFGTALVASGCSSAPTYTVGGQQLAVKESGYATASFFCAMGTVGQLEVVLVDYSPLCGPGESIGADAGASGVGLERNELDLLFMNGDHTDATLPYAVGPSDCTNGPVTAGVATFLHYGDNGTPIVTQAVGGEIFLDAVDATGTKPATGSFTLDFGTQGSIAGHFSAHACD